MTKLLIAGYHGFGNCGDEAILLAMKNNILETYPDISLCVLSNNPQETKEKYGIDAVQRFSFRQVLSAIIKCDIIVSGGGTLLQDGTSTSSLLYYLSIILFGKIMGKKVMLYSSGFGPIHKKGNRRLTKWIINKVDLITLREELSLKEIKRVGITKPPIYITADPAFTLKGCSHGRVADILAQNKVPRNKRLVGISIREWKKQRWYTDVFAEICDYIADTYDTNILIIPMHHPVDLSISKELQSKMKRKSYMLQEPYQSEEIIGIIDELDLVISMRLHTLIFSAIQNVPMIGVVYDPKIDYYLKVLGMESGGDVQDPNVHSLDTATLKALVSKIMENQSDYKEKLAVITKELVEKGKEHDNHLLDLILKK